MLRETGAFFLAAILYLFRLPLSRLPWRSLVSLMQANSLVFKHLTGPYIDNER